MRAPAANRMRAHHLVGRQKGPHPAPTLPTHDLEALWTPQ